MESGEESSIVDLDPLNSVSQTGSLLNSGDTQMEFLAEIALSFVTDALFLEKANALLLNEQQQSETLQIRAESIVRDGGASFPLNDNVDKTLYILQRQFGLVVDETSDTLSAYIAALMNKTVHATFQLIAPESNIDIPPSNLLLRVIAQQLGLTIIVLSTRSMALQYGNDFSSTIVLLEAVDAFKSVRTYTPLSCASCTPVYTATPSPTAELSLNPIAKFRDHKRARHTKDKGIVNVVVGKKCIRERCEIVLRGLVKAAAQTAFDTAMKGKIACPPDLSLLMEQKFPALEKRELGRNRVPPHIVQEAVRDMELKTGQPVGSVTTQAFKARLCEENSDFSSIQVYLETAEEKLRQIWDGYVLEHQHNGTQASVVAPASTSSSPSSGSIQNSEPSKEGADEEQELRMCDASLGKILRPGMYKEAERILTDKQTRVSNYIDEVQVALRKAAIVTCQGLLHTQSENVDLKSFLPKDFKIRDLSLEKNPVVSIGIVSSTFMTKFVKTKDHDSDIDSDLLNLFDQATIQHLSSRLISTALASEPPPKKQKLDSGDIAPADDEDDEEEDNQEDDGDDNTEIKDVGGAKTSKGRVHPAWDTLASIVQQTTTTTIDYTKAPQGMGQVKNEMIRTMATNMKNIWSGDIYGHVKKAVVRYLVRIHLRPLSEKWFREYKQKMAEEKRKEAKRRKSIPRSRHKQARRRHRSLLNQLDHTIHKCELHWSGSTLYVRDQESEATDVEVEHPSLSDGMVSLTPSSRVSRVQKLLYLIGNGPLPFNAESAAAPTEGGHDLLDAEGIDDQDDEVGFELDGIDCQEEDGSGADEFYDQDDEDGFDEVVAELEVSETVNEQQAKQARKAEPTSKHVKGLEVVICKLLDLSETDLPTVITDDDFRAYLFTGHKFLHDEIKVAAGIVNLLRPFAPRKDKSGHIPRHILATGPFVYLANLLLRAMGFQDFTREISPISSAGSIHAIPLGSIGLTQVLCCPDKGHFDVHSQRGELLSKPELAVDHSSLIFAAFFKMETVNSICKAHGLEFANRMMFVDHQTVRILGRKTKLGAPSDLTKKKGGKKATRKNWHPSDADLRQLKLEESKLDKSTAKERAAELGEAIKDSEIDMKGLNRQAAKLELSVKKYKSELQQLKGDDHMADESAEVEDCLNKDRQELYDIRRQIIPQKVALKRLKQKKYDYDRYSKSSLSAPSKKKDREQPDAPTMTAPTLSRPGCMNKTESVDISTLLRDIDANNADPTARKVQLVPGGTDPGSHILFNTVPVPMASLIKLRNRFEVLADGKDPDDGLPSLESMKFPDAHQTTTQQLRHHAGLNKRAKKRRRLISSNRAVSDAHSLLAENSIKKAHCIQDVEQAQTIRRGTRTTLQGFEQSKKMKNSRRRGELELKRTYDRAAAEERKAFGKQPCGKSCNLQLQSLV
ncbi:hypothetical protein EMPS_06960 [Entomortierella parvispora]|uniref:Uncharacterized protein n=1 Tax=Entomortierella parvispora TaxID=205924 RepID=A0A9P3LXZ2_9FUNG|nr:hypothetical protein EMPS_06960 [Entomortierella parvispora]